MRHLPPLLALMATATAAAAHPGHEAAEASGPAHWLTEASHWVVIVLAVLLVAELVRRTVLARGARMPGMNGKSASRSGADTTR